MGTLALFGFYLMAGAAAFQIDAWSNPGSLVPTLGASRAVAALMGAFLVRFPKMQIEMLWVLWLSIAKLMRTGNPFRYSRFQASAYRLLPLWLGMEIFSGTLVAQDGVAPWAHVGGFVFGALVAIAIEYSGLEHKANKAIEEKIGWPSDAELEQAGTMMEQGRFRQALELLTLYVATRPKAWMPGR